MSKTLATFMAIAITAIILGSLMIGIVYQSLSNKNNEHQNNQSIYQLDRN